MPRTRCRLDRIRMAQPCPTVGPAALSPSVSEVAFGYRTRPTMPPAALSAGRSGGSLDRVRRHGPLQLDVAAGQEDLALRARRDRLEVDRHGRMRHAVLVERPVHDVVALDGSAATVRQLAFVLDLELERDDG